MTDRLDNDTVAEGGIDYELLGELAFRPHQLIDVDLWQWTSRDIEGLLLEVRTVHHLLDMVKIPHGGGGDRRIDARVYLAVAELARRRKSAAATDDET